MPGIILAVLAAVAAGVLAERRAGAGAERAASRVLWMMLYVLGPPVYFFNLVDLELDVDVGVGIVLALVTLGLVGLIAHAAARRLRLDRPATGGLIAASVQSNTGYFGFPLTVALLGRDALPVAVAFDALVQMPGLLLGVFAVGATFGDRAGETAADRVRAFFTRNPTLIAVAAALVAPSALAPDALVAASRVLVFAQLPLGFFAVGVLLAADARASGVGLVAPPTRPAAIAIALRLVVAPALLFALAAPLIDLPDQYLLLAACPTGIGALIVAHAFGLSYRIVVPAILWSTALVCVVAAGSVVV